MEYKETAECAFDLMEHFYRIHKEQIDILGADKFDVYVPSEILNLLECRDRITKKITYPIRYRKMTIISYEGSEILFALKEIK